MGDIGLGNPVVLPLFDTSMLMKHRRLWIGLMVFSLSYWSTYYENIYCIFGGSLYCCLVGRVVDGREMAVQFAKYGPNAEKM